MFCFLLKVYLGLMSTATPTKKILKQFEVVRFFCKSLMSTAKALSLELSIGLIEFVIEKGLMSIYWT